MIDINEFKKQVFSTYGILEKESSKGIGRVPIGWKPENDNDDLRLKIREIMWKKVDEYKENTNKNYKDYTIIDVCCRIPEDTMKKALNGRYKITRNFLAKFTVGFKLDIEEANLLFRIHSGGLNLTNDFDYIVFHALETKDDIDDFIEEVNSLIGLNLDKTK